MREHSNVSYLQQ